MNVLQKIRKNLSRNHTWFNCMIPVCLKKYQIIHVIDLCLSFIMVYLYDTSSKQTRLQPGQGKGDNIFTENLIKDEETSNGHNFLLKSQVSVYYTNSESSRRDLKDFQDTQELYFLGTHKLSSIIRLRFFLSSFRFLISIPYFSQAFFM